MEFVLFASVLFALFMTVSGPPAPLCLVQQAYYKLDDQTPCDDGPRQKLSDLVNQPVPAGQGFGAENTADLLLSRCCRLFDYQSHSLHLENMYICNKHLKELSEQWKTNEKLKRGFKRSGSMVSRCNMPNLVGFQGAHQAATLADRSLSKCQSQTIWGLMQMFVPLGTGKFMINKHVGSHKIPILSNYSDVQTSPQFHSKSSPEWNFAKRYRDPNRRWSRNLP